MSGESEPRANDVRRHWQLDPSVTFLNHGSFGACPAAVLEIQAELRARMERQPVQFLARELESLLDAARAALAEFVGARASDLVFVTNATTGANTVLRSLDLAPGDELLVTDHAYNACRNALDFVAAQARARAVVVSVPFPLSSADEIVERLLERVGPRTRLALVDHVTSPTGLVLPIGQIVAALAARGVDTLVDGAHAPGMLPLELETLGAAYYTGNCHKWVCAPKGAAFLWVRPDRQSAVRPVVISHGASSPRRDRSRFVTEFGWVGTDDPTAMLCVPHAIRFLGGLFPGGWAELRRRNRELAVAARQIVGSALGVPAPCPDAMIGSLAALPLASGNPPHPENVLDALQEELLARHGIEVPVYIWPAAPRRLLRLSAQAYNRLEEYQRLAAALVERLGLAPSAGATR